MSYFYKDIMKEFNQIKKELYEACQVFVTKKHQTIKNTIASNKKALLSETKSSAGDKHETGRAMLQLEMEKAGQQLVEIQYLKVTLAKIDVNKSSNLVCLGSVVHTTKANYFLAISSGKITIDTTDYYAISPNSPIGKELLGKKKGDTIQFNKATIINVL